MEIIIVQISDQKWTMEAMHLASALARKIGGRIVLLRCVLANNPGLLGWGIPQPTRSEHQELMNYIAVAEDYGVEYTVQPMQYISMTDALVQATQQLNAHFLLAHIPETRIALWRAFQVWQLKRRLSNCSLYTLDEKHPLNIVDAVEITVYAEDEPIETV